MLSNYHTHSKYCDGKNTLEEVTQAAIAQGVKSLGFSSHAPVPYAVLWCMKLDALPVYLKEIDDLQEKYKGQIQLYRSLEIDFVPEVMGPADDLFSKLDYRIGSVHFVDCIDENTPFEIDGSFAGFEQGLKAVFRDEIKKCIKRYFELTKLMLQNSTPDILGHMDKINIQNEVANYYATDETWYLKEVEEVLQLAKERDVIVEVNTRGIYRKKTTMTYPEPKILSMVREKQIPVTINSDAHMANEVTREFDYARNLLKDLGITSTWALDNYVWKEYAL